MDKVLLLTYFFPPLGGGGVQRSAKFFKYLPIFGWSPVVIAARPNRRNTIEQGLDQTLLRDVANEKAIFRCGSFEFSSLYSFLYRIRLRKLLFETERWIPLLHMDYKIGWYRPALNQAERILKSTPVRAIYSSSPPYSTHLAALRLKRLHGLPWIADFRDPWTQIGGYNPPSRFHAGLDRRLEFQVLTVADVVIANTNQNRVNLISEYDICPTKIKVIPNGFDPADFVVRAESGAPPGRFVISCVGKFYQMKEPGLFFRTYRRFCEDHVDTTLRLVGRHSRAVQRAAREILKNESWEQVDQVSHEEAVSKMQGSSVLLTNLASDECDHWVPGKLYEYLASRKPILLIGPKDGMAADIIRCTRTGKVAG